MKSIIILYLNYAIFLLKKIDLCFMFLKGD